MRLPGWIRVIHSFPVAVVMATIGFVLVILGRGHMPPWEFIRGLGAVLMTQIATGALNDFIDRERDAVTQPDKPLPRGEVTPAIALFLVAGSLVLYIPLALSFGMAAFLVLTLGLAGGLSYDLGLKSTPLSPLPYIVGFLSLATWAAIVTGTFHWRLFFLFPGAALLIVSAHLAQSLPDTETDRRHGQRGQRTGDELSAGDHDYSFASCSSSSGSGLGPAT